MQKGRTSRKRDAIYQTICSTNSHPTAEWVYGQLKPELPNLSLGTVYRNLAGFRNEDKLVCVATVNGQERFDAAVEPHAHFICRTCGKVEDLHQVSMPGIPQADVKIDSCQLNYYGVCKECEESCTQI